MGIFETHAHYDDARFDEDREELLASMPKRGIETIINVGSSLAGAMKSVELAEKYPFVYAAVGVHPSDIGDFGEEPENKVMSRLMDATTKKKVVAIGEIGLDYYWDKDPNVQERQQYWFSRQIDLAVEADLPVIIHSRDACEATLREMRRAAELGVPGVIHCFSYSLETAEQYLKMGYYIGIGGVVTFKNAKKLVEIATTIPLERILLETDCPYLAPEPFRGERNDSALLPYVVQKIAKLREITEDEVIQVTRENARKLFGV
ncbi:MAG: TatD family hydrolase [Lachnospiraceae bacterium]|nr:TatD family hydrolase [Lachnospiraceae bacterium]